MSRRKRLGALLMTPLAMTLVLTLPACESEGPLEEAGEQIDEGVEEIGDAIEDATDG